MGSSQRFGHTMAHSSNCGRAIVWLVRFMVNLVDETKCRNRAAWLPGMPLPQQQQQQRTVASFRWHLLVLR